MRVKHLLTLKFILAAMLMLLSCSKKSTEPGNAVLEINATSLDFGIDQVTLHFYISNGGESILDWTIENGTGDWYQCTPESGSTGNETDTVTISVDRSGLTGEFSDTLSISSNGGNASIEITMSVATSPTLSVYPLNIDFGSTLTTAHFQIVNVGPGRLDWSITENIDWLELTPSSGFAIDEIDTVSITIQRPNLANNTLIGEISISSNGGGTQIVGVSARDTVYSSGIYAFLMIERQIIRHNMGYQRSDYLTARFESVYSPCEPSIPLNPDSVFCSGYTLLWNPDGGNYLYRQTMPRTFLSLGETYIFEVIGGGNIPSFYSSVTFPMYAPSLTLPADSSTFSRDANLGIEWNGAGGDMISISLISASDSICGVPFDLEGLYGITVETDNDGQYAFLSSQLSGLNPGEYKLILTNHNAQSISEPGYNPDSYIMAKTTSYITMYLQ